MTLAHGDCLDVMAAMEPESVDAVVTDPPYGLEFMGKEWDKLVGDMPNAAAWAGRRGTKRIKKGTEQTSPTNPWGKESSGYRGGERHGSKRCRICGRRQFSGTPCKCEAPDWETVYPSGPPSGAVAMGRWHARWAEAAFRVAKPSAYLLAFGGTRTVHRMTVAIEDAGWIIRDMLVWAYASGFPKSKASLKPAWEPIVMARKPGPLRELAIDACRIGLAPDETPEMLGGGTFGGTFGNGKPAADAGSPLGRWPANVILTDPIFDGGCAFLVRSEDETPAAIRRCGRGRLEHPVEDRGRFENHRNYLDSGVVGGGDTGSMPASYVRSVASGNVNSYAPGVGDPEGGVALGYGDSGTYSRFFQLPQRYNGPCSNCGRVSGAEPSSDPPNRSGGSVPSHAQTEAFGGSDTTTASPTTSDTERTSWHGESGSTSRTKRSLGSRPAAPNLSSDPANNAARNGTSSDTTTTTLDRWTCDSCVEAAMRSSTDERGFAEQPESPRWFLIPKADRADREPVLGGLPVDGPRVLNSGSSGRTLRDGEWIETHSEPRRRANHHPTVKPVDLMRHLVRLVTPTGGTVLDPFAGSGSTLLAAEMEGFDWIGIEKEAEYVAIAEARLNGTQRGLGLPA